MAKLVDRRLNRAPHRIVAVTAHDINRDHLAARNLPYLTTHYVIRPALAGTDQLRWIFWRIAPRRPPWPVIHAASRRSSASISLGAARLPVRAAAARFPRAGAGCPPGACAPPPCACAPFPLPRASCARLRRAPACLRSASSCFLSSSRRFCSSSASRRRFSSSAWRRSSSLLSGSGSGSSMTGSGSGSGSAPAAAAVPSRESPDQRRLHGQRRKRRRARIVERHHHRSENHDVQQHGHADGIRFLLSRITRRLTPVSGRYPADR